MFTKIEEKFSIAADKKSLKHNLEGYAINLAGSNKINHEKRLKQCGLRGRIFMFQ